MRTILVFLQCFFVSVFASIAPQTATLKNGLKVAVFQNEMLQSVDVFMAYDIGTADDPLNIVGISHMLEHMMFKGTKNFPDNTIDKMIAEHGGYSNAFTTFDTTVYTISLPAEYLSLALEIEADRMENLDLKDEDFQSERKVVLEERQMRLGNHPLKTAIEVVQRVNFVAHPYGTMPIGYEAHIKNYTIEALKKHYHQWYIPNNGTLVIVGPYNLQYVMPLVEKYFEKIQNRDMPVRSRVPEVDREGLTATVEQESPRAQNIFIEIFYKVPTFIKNPKKMLTMDLLVSTLTGNDSRELLKKIVKDKQLALDINTNYSAGKDDQGFSVSLMLDSKMSVEKAEAFLFETLHQFLHKGLNKVEFDHAKKEMLNAFAYVFDGNAYLVNMAHLYIKGFPKEAFDQYQQLLESITFEDVHEMLKNILAKPPVSITHIYPVGAMPKRVYQKVLKK